MWHYFSKRLRCQGLLVSTSTIPHSKIFYRTTVALKLKLEDSIFATWGEFVAPINKTQRTLNTATEDDCRAAPCAISRASTYARKKS